MKKIKLITPILGLATISSSLMPLTSCKSKNDLGITKEQWNKAFEEIKDSTNPNRNFTIDGDIMLLGLIEAVPFSVAAANGYMVGTWWTDEYYTKLVDDTILWSCDPVNTEPSPNFMGSFARLTPMLWAFLVCGEIFDESYEVLEKVDNLQYKAQWLNILDTLNGNCYFTFNDNFKVTKIKVDAYATIGTIDIPVIDATLNFSEYGTTVLPQGIDEKFTNVKDHRFEAELVDSKYVAAQKKYETSQFNFFMPDSLALDNLDTINVTNGDYMNPCAFYLNGYQLIKDIDYTVVKQVDDKPAAIKLNSPLKAKDKLIIIAGPGGAGSCLGLELKHGE